MELSQNTPCNFPSPDCDELMSSRSAEAEGRVRACPVLDTGGGGNFLN
jgi:hypothetical protein